MTKKDKLSPFLREDMPKSKPLKVKEWAIAQIKKGKSPNKVAKDIKELFGVSVCIMSVYRWRYRYTEATGEKIPRWYDLNPTLEQQRQNKGKIVYVSKKKNKESKSND